MSTLQDNSTLGQQIAYNEEQARRQAVVFDEARIIDKRMEQYRVERSLAASTNKFIHWVGIVSFVITIVLLIVYSSTKSYPVLVTFMFTLTISIVVFLKTNPSIANFRFRKVRPM